MVVDRKSVLVHAGGDMEAKTSRAIAAKLKNNPGNAGDTIVFELWVGMYREKKSDDKNLCGGVNV